MIEVFSLGVMCGATSTAGITLMALLLVSLHEKQEEQKHWGKD